MIHNYYYIYPKFNQCPVFTKHTPYRALLSSPQPSADPRLVMIGLLGTRDAIEELYYYTQLDNHYEPVQFTLIGIFHVSV